MSTSFLLAQENSTHRLQQQEWPRTSPAERKDAPLHARSRSPVTARMLFSFRKPLYVTFMSFLKNISRQFPSKINITVIN